MAKEYNGHHCWTCWNVALWIGNDEGLYRLALDCINRPHAKTGKKVSLHVAANRFLDSIADKKTPDGARYSTINVKRALEALQ